MINPKDYLMVQLVLSKAKAEHKYHRVLSASRRCLEDFSVPFADTGYRLVRRDEEEKLLDCLLDKFDGTHDHEDIIWLSAPARDEYSEYYYDLAECSLTEALTAEVGEIIEKILDKKRITARTYAESIRLLDRAEHHNPTEATVYAREQLSAIYRESVTGQSKRIVSVLRDIIEQLEPEYEH